MLTGYVRSRILSIPETSGRQGTALAKYFGRDELVKSVLVTVTAIFSDRVIAVPANHTSEAVYGGGDLGPLLMIQALSLQVSE